MKSEVWRMGKGREEEADSNDDIILASNKTFLFPFKFYHIIEERQVKEVFLKEVHDNFARFDNELSEAQQL
jgi:hypothetical protein